MLNQLKNVCVFLEIKNHFQKAGVMLRQMEWRVQNGHITKNGVLPSNYFIENFV